MNSPPDQGPSFDRALSQGPAGTRASSRGDEPTRVSTGETGSVPADGGDDIPLGPNIEGYALKEEIHRGGQGIVYRALQLGTKRLVALKVLLEGPLAAETTRRRFEREIELAASLRHPNIVTILDSGLSRGRYYFAMEYIDGVRLDRYLAQRRPPLDDTLLLFEKVCEAVNFAHQRGVIHRDLKPPNILVDADGEPHVLDFGLAKPVHPLAASETTVQMLSVSGQLLGTVAYMSPEQAAGAQDVDLRSDVYSLGVVFYEALVGKPPYSVDGPLGEILTRIATADPVNPRSLLGRVRSDVKIDDELATILLKALEKEPLRRYQTAGELGRDLRRRLNGEPIEAKRASGLYMLKKTLRRYRLHAATASLILVMLVGFLITFAVLFTGERAARERADEKGEEARLAVIAQADALHEARDRTTEAMRAQQELRRALVRQHIQRGDLALARNDVREARDNYWQAMDVAPGPAAIWALRRYYLQTPDIGAVLLTCDPPDRRTTAPVARLSPDGELAGLCADSDSILVRALPHAADQRLADAAKDCVLHWVHARGPVSLFDVADDGALAATGAGWAQAWEPGALCPSVAAQLPEGTLVHAVYAVAGGRAVMIVAQRFVQFLAGAQGQETRSVALQGTPVGRADYAPQSRLLAIPTTAGVELVTVNESGPLVAELAWTGPTPARAVRFDGEELLAVLADAVYVATLGGSQRGEWTRFIDAAPNWDLFDMKRGVGTIVFGTRDGYLAVYRSGDLLSTWRCTVERLEQLRLSSDDRSVVTLDERGTVTHWVPPERIEQRRLIQAGAPSAWATSGDGSTVLLAAARGQVVAYCPPRTTPVPDSLVASSAPTPDNALAEPRTVLRPRLLDLGGERMALALSADGRRAIVRERSTLRLIQLSDLATHTVPWTHPRLAVPDQVALSPDGELVALLARSQAGDQQQITFLHWPATAAERAPEAADQPGAVPPLPLEFVGAVVRDMAFVPGTRKLLIVRSNGQLLLFDADHPRESGMPEQWLELEAPATTVAFNRTGEYLAAACEDGVLRLISVPRRDIRHRIALGQRVSALAFNPRDDVLLVRTADGSVHLFDPATGESLAAWPLPVDGEHPLACWIGDDADAMLLGQKGGVYEYRYAIADAVIERNRAFAGEERVAHDLADADFAGAWTAATALSNLDPQRGRPVQIAILEAALRRPKVNVPAAWTQTVLGGGGGVSSAKPPARPFAAGAPLPAAEGIPAWTYIRLGHAAYDGERFAAARDWLRHGAELAGDAVDALTRWRIAQCDYLAGAYDEAAAGFATTAAQQDFDPAGLPALALQRVSALLLAGRLSDARQAALHVGIPDARGHQADIVAATYASVIARLITGIERESAAAAVVDSLVGNFGDRSLLFQDDEHFFVGELDRQRGDYAAAAVHYQRCIDLARDDWPSNWARYRLSQLPVARADDDAHDTTAAAEHHVPTEEIR